MFGETLGRDLARGCEHGECDWEIEAGSFFAKTRGGQVDRDPAQGPFELCARDAAADALLRLLARLVRKTHDRERRHAALQMRLHLDGTSFETDESMGGGACEHISTLRSENARNAHALNR